AFGMIPDQIGRLGGLTMVTSFFLHGSWSHLLGNLYFLYVFGDNVENRIGWRRMLILVFVATIAGDLLHAAADSRSSVPCIGASGGISGVLAFYALAFPDKKISIFWASRYTMPRWIEMSAWTAFGLWIAMQTLIVMQQLAGLGRVSALAHLGGVMAGAVVWLIWKNSLPKPEKKDCPIRSLVADGKE
ncbi:MAG: rhomboid family intramembrane serine protease, partial [Verrucomicrobiota bacterium]